MGIKMVKPDYKVPLMKEVKQIPLNNFKVASTFSGTGGSCLGYRMAGFSVGYANEFVESARDSYRLNHQDGFLDSRDIRNVKGSDILEKMGIAEGELDILDGSPPCVSFSMAGSREKKWGKVQKYHGRRQVADNLFDEFCRLVNETQPKVFIAENVKGLVMGAAKGYFKLIFKALESCGYSVKARVLDGSYLGIPQKRQRVFLIGVRNDLQLEPVFPKPFPYRYSVQECLRGIEVASKENAVWLNEASKTYKVWQGVKPGRNFSEYRMKLDGKYGYFNFIKANKYLPSPTIVASENTFHWNEPRRLSIPEIKRIGSFPDDFLLAGSVSEQWARIGLSVPPFMTRAVASVIQTEILEHANSSA